MSSILITGGAGAIGFHLSKALSKRGDEVYIVDNYCRSKRDNALVSLFEKKNVHEIPIDLCDKSNYSKLPGNIDYIYHLAAMNGTQNFYQRPFDVIENSTLPTIELLKFYSKNNRLKRFIYAGSSESYSSSVSLFNWEVPTQEDVPLGIENPKNLRWSYGGSKLHGELATISAGSQFMMPFTIVRYHNVYGPRMGDKHIIPDFLARAKLNKFELHGYEDTRSFIYVEDAVDGTIKCAESESTINEIIHLGGTPEITMLDLGQKIMTLLGRKDKITCYPSPEGSVKRRAPNLSKIKKLTGFKQKVSLNDGLKKTISYYFKDNTNL